MRAAHDLMSNRDRLPGVLSTAKGFYISDGSRVQRFGMGSIVRIGAPDHLRFGLLGADPAVELKSAQARLPAIEAELARAQGEAKDFAGAEQLTALRAEVRQATRAVSASQSRLTELDESYQDLERVRTGLSRTCARSMQATADVSLHARVLCVRTTGESGACRGCRHHCVRRTARKPQRLSVRSPFRRPRLPPVPPVD
jgi:hypothetical protein